MPGNDIGGCAGADAVRLSHQHAVISAGFGLLLVPPVIAVLALLALPWFGVDLNVNKPAMDIARFFSESFERRTGMPGRSLPATRARQP
jgi:hypothetical protein